LNSTGETARMDQPQPTTTNWRPNDAYMQGVRAWVGRHSKKIHITLEMKCSRRLAYPRFVIGMAAAYGGRFQEHEMLTQTIYLVDLRFITEAGANKFAALIKTFPNTHQVQQFGILYGED